MRIFFQNIPKNLKVGQSTRMHCIYQNIDNIYWNSVAIWSLVSVKELYRCTLLPFPFLPLSCKVEVCAASQHYNIAKREGGIPMFMALIVSLLAN